MGYSIVNILGGLLIVTSTMVVVSKNIKHAIRWYAVQSLVLVGLLATLGVTTGAQELLMWAGSALSLRLSWSLISSTAHTRRWASRATHRSRPALSRVGHLHHRRGGRDLLCRRDADQPAHGRGRNACARH